MRWRLSMALADDALCEAAPSPLLLEDDEEAVADADAGGRGAADDEDDAPAFFRPRG
jgi:hypothetical protein